MGDGEKEKLEEEGRGGWRGVGAAWEGVGDGWGEGAALV